MTIGGQQRMAGGEPDRRGAAAQPRARARPAGQRHRRGRGRRHRRGQAGRARPGARCPSTTGPRSSSRPPTCWPGPWRATINAATMLGQSKSPYQAEIDAACELIDFWRYNVHFARRLLAEQPESAPGAWNRMEYRPLEGFVLAITPFNFTSIAGNLPTAPALLGNVVVWKPSPTQQLRGALHHAPARGGRAAARRDQPGHRGRPGGLPGRADPPRPGRHPLHRLHRHLPAPVADRRARTSPATATTPGWSARPAARTSSIAHPSADPDVLAAALIRGAFEYQGQKCSAASRAYIAESVWNRMRDDFLAQVESLTMGDVAADLSLFMGAVIDARAFAKHAAAIDRARTTATITVAGGRHARRHGRLLRPAHGAGVHRPGRRGVHAPSTSARSWPCTSTTDARLRRRCWPRPPTSPRTR